MTGTTTEASACTLGNGCNQSGCSNKSNLSACSGTPTEVCRTERPRVGLSEVGKRPGDLKATGVQFWLDAEKELTADE
jgi:hypothetical protein